MAAAVNGQCLGWAARDSSGLLVPCKFSRRSVRSDDVSISIFYCGVCFIDAIWTRNNLGGSKYPLVPGHEMVGIVTEVGSNAERFKVGDRVGVGTYVNSCRECECCDNKLESHCLKGPIFTYCSEDVDGTTTQGGYSSYIVVHERYCYKIPENYQLAPAAPLPCAGISIYSAMMRHKMNQPGKSLGVIGFGGVGRLTVKFGKAFGLKVTVLSTSNSDREEALNTLGADNFVLQRMVASNRQFDFIISTSSIERSFDLYLSCLKPRGVLVLLIASGEVKFNPRNLISAARSISGNAEGGTEQIQEMLDFCACHQIYPDIELIPIEAANEEIEKLSKKELKYFPVIDIATALQHHIGTLKSGGLEEPFSF